MAKKVSKFFRIGVEGDTCDGRVISAQDIQEMAETFDPRVYGCRINLEHLRGILPDGIFKRYGDVAELKAVCARLAQALAADDFASGPLLETHEALLRAGLGHRFPLIVEAARSFNFEQALEVLQEAMESLGLGS